jgi:hypothetical protein
VGGSSSATYLILNAKLIAAKATPIATATTTSATIFTFGAGHPPSVRSSSRADGLMPPPSACRSIFSTLIDRLGRSLIDLLGTI